MSKINTFVFAGVTDGLQVTAGDTDDDGMAEIAGAKGPAPGADSAIAVYDYDGTALVEKAGSRFLAFAGSLGGASGAFGQWWDRDFHLELLASRGALPSSTCEVRAFDDAAAGFGTLGTFDPYPAQTHGSTLASSEVGF